MLELYMWAHYWREFIVKEGAIGHCGKTFKFVESA